MKIDIETLRQTKGIGAKTLERIIEQHKINEGIKSFESKYVPSDQYRIDKEINLWQGDCIQLMHHIPDKSIDMVLCDLPYGTTACGWDEIIPFELLWSHYRRIVKDNGVILLFGTEPFSTKVRNSNPEWYKYDWYWNKISSGSGVIGKYRPLNIIENIIVFYNNNTTYNPIMELRDKSLHRTSGKSRVKHSPINTISPKEGIKSGKYKYPTNVFTRDRMSGELNSKHRLHPTQKPVELGEYLIKTYTDKGMTILDNTMGVGTFGVSAKNLNRKFIGIELDEEYFNVAKKRINNA